MTIKLQPNFCKTHPRYMVKRKPRSLCEACWTAWVLFKNIGPGATDEDEERSKRLKGGFTRPTAPAVLKPALFRGE